MGLPNISIIFKTTATASVKRSEKGTVGLILVDANKAAAGAHRLTAAVDIPTALDGKNKGYIQRAFLGYVNPPREVICYVVDSEAADLTTALAYFATVEVDYLCGPHDCTTEQGSQIASWVKSRRGEAYGVKAVLPNQAVDHEGIVNFAAAGIVVGETVFTAAEYCSRIAGLIAGTPMTISCTFAPLPEVTDIQRMTKVEMDTAIDAGKLILYHDGEKVKLARGVNSLVTTTQEKGEAFKKLKIVEAVDMMQRDIRRTAEDSYLGKYANSYDNKILLLTAIKGYLESLELDGILDRGKSSVSIDVAAQTAYLKGTGVDTEKMSEQEIKEANTGSQVFLAATAKPLDAIEDVKLVVAI